MKNVWDELLQDLLKAERAQDSRPVNNVTGYFGTSSPGWMKNVQDKPDDHISVEAKVQNIRDRVRLDNITKEAGSKFPLFLRKANSGAATQPEVGPQAAESSGATMPDEVVELVAYTKALIDSRRGHIDIPAVIFELKKVFSDELVRNNLEYLQEVATSARKRFEHSKGVRMPSNLGQVSETLEAEDKKLFPIITDTLKQM